jgi:hypothetical protein
MNKLRRFRLKRTVRIAIVLSFACAALAAFSNVAQAQRIDLGFAGSTVIAPGANSCSGDCQISQSLTGGFYPGFNADVIFWHNLGAGFEYNWRGSQGGGAYAADLDVNYRPIFFNFNAVYSPKLANHIYLEVVGGVGAMSTHLYECDDCGIAGGSTEVASSSHFDVDVGGGIKLYASHGFFIRPEIREYWINNDTNFAGSHATRVGATLGYTFGGGH